jgi:hypothetical protein
LPAIKIATRGPPAAGEPPCSGALEPPEPDAGALVVPWPPPAGEPADVVLDPFAVVLGVLLLVVVVPEPDPVPVVPVVPEVVPEVDPLAVDPDGVVVELVPCTMIVPVMLGCRSQWKV